MHLLIVRFTTFRRPSQITFKHLRWLLLLQLYLTKYSTAASQQAGIISIIPSGPAAGFTEESSFNLTCTSNREGNVTWALPNLNDELDNFPNKVPSDLAERAQMTFSREGDLFVAMLTVTKVKKSDSGQYTCHPVGVDVDSTGQLQSYPSIHIFISWKGFDGVELNPLKSVYVVTASQQLFVVPCFNHFPAQYFSPTELVLQKKKLLTDDNEMAWESLDLSHKKYLNWSFADFKGIAIHNPKNGEYRCGAMKFNGTCSTPKWSLYGFFIIEESIDKDVVDDTDQQPRIRPSALPFLIFSSGVTFSLMCKTGAAASHQWNVNWRLPSTFHSDDYESAQVKSLGRRVVATLAKGNGKNFQSDYSVLTISNASHLDTGYYTCHRADNETISAKQYVFVRDWHALVATSVNRNFEYGKVNVDIGCRPTHPSIQMSLNQITADGSPVTVYPSGNNGIWSYNLFEGFKRIQNISWQTEGMYQCIGRKNYLEGPSRHRSIVYTNELFIGVRGVEINLVISNGSRQVEEGDDVQLTCRQKVPNRLQVESDSNSVTNLTWEWISTSNTSVTAEFDGSTNDHSVPGGGKLMTVQENEFYVSHLRWENISMDVAGTFKCNNKGSDFSATYVLAVSSAKGVYRQMNESRLIAGGNTLTTYEILWLVCNSWILFFVHEYFKY